MNITDTECWLGVAALIVFMLGCFAIEYIKHKIRMAQIMRVLDDCDDIMGINTRRNGAKPPARKPQ